MRRKHQWIPSQADVREVLSWFNCDTRNTAEHLWEETATGRGIRCADLERYKRVSGPYGWYADHRDAARVARWHAE